jgi:putative ABC transport system permease protein
VSIREELEERQETFNAILLLFEGFTGLGLLAGLAALGVIAVRAVVERRQQIGVLRAIGFSSGLIRAELLLEMSFVATIGIAMGTTLALVLAWRLFEDGVFGSTGGLAFYVPVVRIAIFAGVALVASLAMTYLPARQAARVTVAEALRYE